eukprot:TRINITY_DN16261_c0_g1_i1.p1 TRINITY_DN16261_c0_g1~~TRINITY_DN16261_c0_g1_i1.p1  ORF type:complete len:833 (+),score=244.52 TRINITY_DN16261_c0_g1_i1:34-2499(+)
MGGGASVNKEVKESLDDIEKRCADKKTGHGADGLDEMQEFGQKLKEAMDTLAAAKDPDIKMINHVEDVSDLVMSNLESRITVDLIVRSDYADVEKKILEIAADLDTVRSTPATTKLQSKILAARRQCAASKLTSVSNAVKEVTQPPHLLGCCEKMLKELDAIAPVPLDKDLAVKFLQLCAGFSAKLQKGFPFLLKQDGDSAIAPMKELASRLDLACDRLKKQAEGAGTWQPLAPTLDKLVLQFSASQTAYCLQQAGAEFAQAHFAQGLAMLVSVSEVWWTRTEGYEKRDQLLQEAQKIFKLAESKALEASGKKGLDVDLSDFAESFDKLYAGFAGLPTPDGGGLAKQLRKLAEAPLEDLLVRIESEVASSADANLATMLGSVQGLSLELEKASPEALERARSACQAIEAWAENAMKDADHVKAGRLCNFAIRYDEARAKLSILGEVAASLAPRLRTPACLVLLKAADEELSKESGLNPAAVLEFVKKVGLLLPEGGLDDEARGNLQAVISKTSERVCESYTKALEAKVDGKIRGLRKFAEGFDAAVVAAGGGAELAAKLEAAAAEAASAEAGEKGEATDATPADATADAAEAAASGAAEDTLADVTADAAMAGSSDAPADAVEETEAAEPSAESVAAVAEKLDAVEAELAKEEGMNPVAVLRGLASLQLIWEPVAKSTELKGRLTTVFDGMKLRMQKAMEESAAADDGPKLRKLVGFARKCDEVQENLSACSPDFCASVIVAGAAKDLEDAEAELSKEKGMNPMVVLRNLRNLKHYDVNFGSVTSDSPMAELRKRLVDICESLRTRITASYQESPEKRPAL